MADSSALQTKACQQYMKLYEAKLKAEKAGALPAAIERQFTEALATCRRGMMPQEIELLERMALKARADAMMEANSRSFTIDTSKAPYTVPCPVCMAFALGACMSKRREACGEYPGMKFPIDARTLPLPHPERQLQWEEHPEWRVRAM